MEKNYEALINAIILQAFKDLRWAQRRLLADPDNEKARWMIEDVEHFMRSGWITFLTDFDGEWVLSKFWEKLNVRIKKNENQ